MENKSNLVFAKGKDGHYRYMNKKELKKKNKTMSLFTFLFYLLGLAVIIGAGYFIYTDLILPFIEKYY